ncbi:uncharacterized protein C8Q71DRAFT_859134 [Rhodofomes roseus]|uniref:Uncharacterized protein n=1 Tax=Rhodofomes roseus TaxID=34475 RepID=A0ABQ8KBE1_9APHY|nr:uncharacterized protein C8Q71DRAFT_859134 [Rhodofomes roseus]KAH9834769.1 hypothetical protein C8Q71DRAFT_859134 [Rhodofomes roseus]
MVFSGVTSNSPVVEQQETRFMVPRHGTYLVLQLDPVKMVEPLRDPKLLAAAQGLRVQKYVAHVTAMDELPMPGKPDHKCRIALVGQGLCPKDDDACIEPQMCIPIFPETEHPLSRAPLQPSRPFPFPNCYQYASAVVPVRIPNIPECYDHKDAISLSARETIHRDMYFCEDVYRRRALRDAKPAIEEPELDDDASVVESLYPETVASSEARSDSRMNSRPSVPSGLGRDAESHCDAVRSDLDPADPDDVYDSTTPSSSASSICSSESDWPDSASTAPSDVLYDLFLDDPTEDRVVIPLVSVSLNLSDVDRVNSPTDFMKEVADILRLIEDSRERRATGKRSARPPVASTPALTEDDVPEPAVGVRPSIRVEDSAAHTTSSCIPVKETSGPTATGSRDDFAADSSALRDQDDNSDHHRKAHDTLERWRALWRGRMQQTGRRCAAFIKPTKGVATSSLFNHSTCR